ncbi:MAG TPA: M48 family metallopeptidase [Armatimonadota bacterium]|nr:M48 family metallopeptidase [Armatimonadota bacterium]
MSTLRRRYWMLLLALLLGVIGLPGGGAFADEPSPPAGMRAMISGDPPTPEEDALARRRHDEGRLLMLAGVGWQIALLGGFLLLGGARWLGKLAALFDGRWPLAAVVVVGLVTVVMALLTLPLDYYSGFIVPHKYGLSNQTPAAWLRDYLVGGAAGLVITLPLALLFYGLLRIAPGSWWAWLALAAAPITIVLVVIQPVFIAPLFNTFTPLRDDALRREILAMAHAQGIQARDVFQVDASRQSDAANAYVNGFGPTHRIVLYDTLLRDFTPAEIKFVMAHEMGHYVLGHIVRGIVLAVFGVLLAGLAIHLAGGWLLARHGAALGAASLAAPALYPLLLLFAVLLGLVGTPPSAYLSRRMEWEADRFALRVTRDPDAGIRAFYKLARRNIALTDPPRWEEALVYTHPSIKRRVEALERAKAGE